MNRGSEWSKWDLHLHTPDSRLANKFGGQWDSYVEAIVANELAVIGATNYFCFADGELERLRERLSAAGSKALVLGNLEFRISQANKDDEQINVHVLFAERLSTAQILAGVARIPLEATAPGGRTLFCCDADFQSGHVDYSNAVVEFGRLLEGLRTSFAREDYLIALCPSGYGNFRPRNGDGRGVALARRYDAESDLMFGRLQDRDFFLNASRFDGATQKAVFACSDAHERDEVGDKFTWVKARPGFDGLRQALFEPEIRISLSDEPSRRESAKAAFQEFRLLGRIVDGEELRFKDSGLPVNSGLVAIIGGRGTGKSVLLDCLYKSTHVRWGDDGRLSALSGECFEADFQKQGVSNSIVRVQGANPGGVSYLHVRQGDVRRIAEDPDALSEEIRALLGLRGDDAEQSSSTVRSLLGEMEAIRSWFKETNDADEPINSKEFNLRVIKENGRRIEAISSDESRQLITDYESAISGQSKIATALEKIASIRARVEMLELDVSQAIFGALSSIEGIDAPQLSFASQLEVLTSLGGHLEKLRDLKVNDGNRLRAALRERGIEQDPEGLLDKIGVFRAEIDAAEARLKEFESNDKLLNELLARRSAHARTIIDEIEAQKRQIDASFQSLRAGKQGWSESQAQLVKRLLSEVEVSGEVQLDLDAFYVGLARYLDLRRFRAVGERGGPSIRLTPKFGVRDIDSFKALVTNESIIYLQEGSEPISIEQLLEHDGCFVEGGAKGLLEFLFIPSNVRRYLKARARILYKGKEPRRLSVGQRGTFYLCMKLATDPFGSPFVFDQPEDDLDNEFIVNELVPLFRDIKKYRQLIVATHNANLVINADADQVVVAKNHDDELGYSAGAIEDNWVRATICQILEGGEEAFLRRERKYGFGRK